MRAIDERVIHETTEGPFHGGMSFPEVVRRLADAGVERYHADLVRLEKTFYSAEGASARAVLPLAGAPPVAERFSADAARDAVAAIQRGEIDYPEFLRRIMDGGAGSYTVFLHGRKTIYFGRHGDFYVEVFPGSP